MSTLVYHIKNLAHFLLRSNYSPPPVAVEAPSLPSVCCQSPQFNNLDQPAAHVTVPCSTCDGICGKRSVLPRVVSQGASVRNRNSFLRVNTVFYAMADSKGVRLALLLPPFFVVLIAFFGFIGYVSWSLHLFYPAAPHLRTECALLRDPSKNREYLQNRTVLQPPPGNATEDLIGTKCWSIRKRWYFPNDVPDGMEVHHPLYLIRIVSRDYDFFEEVFNMLYSPIHFFCFPISELASDSFEMKVRFLGACMLNVIVPPGRYDESNATDTFRGHSACFERMDGFEWKHTLVVQESEIPLQSIHFIADRMRRMGDGSRVGNELVGEETTRILHDKESAEIKAAEDLIRQATCAWLIGKRDPLALSRSLAPHFYKLVEEDTSLAACQSNVTSEGPCQSKRRDMNGNCIWGMENYQQAMRSKSLFTRADPRFDMGFVECVHEFVFHRTYDTSSYSIHYGSH